MAVLFDMSGANFLWGINGFREWADHHVKSDLDSINLYQVQKWDLIFVALVVAFLVYFLFRKRNAERRRAVSRTISKILLPSALIVWLLGVLIYIVGFYNTSVTGVSVVLRSIVASFKMFVIANELARVPAFLQNDKLYMLLFAVTHFAAALISFLYVFRMIGYTVRSSGDVLVQRLFHSKDKTVHVFWGVNEASLLLAEDIYDKCPGETIIFIDIDKDPEDDTKKKLTLSRITNIITISDSDIARLDKINALIAHCYDGPASLGGTQYVDVFKMLRLKNIGEIVRKSREAAFYLLSDDEAFNISCALVFQKDKALCAMKKVIIRIHARKGANNEVFDHYSQYDRSSQKLKMTIVDSAYLSVIGLKQNEDCHPVNTVRYDTDTGLVDSKFTSMVVGFGATGQEAFRFLYEFATFIGPDLKKVPFKCYAIDEKMDKIEGLFRAKVPESIISEEELSLIKTSVDSSAFWDVLGNIIDDLNYVVIALNNDEVGLSFAVNLFEFALQHRSGRDKVMKIYLRSYTLSYRERMDEVERLLNEVNTGANVELRIFGGERDIYTCASIRQNKIIEDAKKFHWVYTGRRKSAEDQWEEDFGNDKINDMITDRGYSCYHAVYDINRRISQNISNSLHYHTKITLMGLDDADKMCRFHEYANSREDNTTEYHNCFENDAAELRNMAILEHERWISAHKLMGFQYAEKNDIVRKCNSCIRPLDELDEVKQSYDYNIVDTTINLAYENRQHVN